MRTAILLGAAFALSASLASAATFNASFYKVAGDAGAFDLADARQGVTSGNLVGTFQTSAIDYPNGAGDITATSGSLAAFLGAADSASFVGASAPVDLNAVNLSDSVFVFTGLIDLTGVDALVVGSDDGFELKLDGQVPASGSAGRRSFTTSVIDVSGLSGLTALELLTFEDSGKTGVEFFTRSNGVDTLATAAVAPVPLPATGALLLAGVAGLALVRRNRR